MTDENAWLPTEKDIENYKLLKDMLRSQKKEFDILSKKKADEQLNPMKIKMANRVLEPLKELFKHEESHNFLDTLNEDEMPTNSDVVLIISQYETAVNGFKNRYYLRDKYQYPMELRWMTEEYPPDFYANEENDEE
ncbi:hypothetical protein ACFL9U_05690 [Thermodesulfobacteriota bacterium]